VALAALCLVGQLSSLAHMAVVRHVACSEHGELVHADEGRTAGPARHTASESDSALPRLAPVPTPPSAHGHDHCLVTTLRRERGVLPQQSHLAGVAPAEQRLVGDGRDVPPVASFALFRLAPKNSPPV
jgi:hypothetical protein